MPNKKLSKAEFASAILRGEFPDLVAQLDEPQTAVSHTQQPADPMLALRKAKTIEPDKLAEFSHNTLLGKIGSYLSGGATDPEQKMGPVDLLMSAIPLIGGPEKTLGKAATDIAERRISTVPRNMPTERRMEELIKKFGGTGIDHPSPKDVASRVMELTDANGGATFHLTQGDMSGTSNYAVSPYKDRELVLNKRPSEKDIISYMNTHKDLLNTPDHSLGVWHDEPNKRYVLDVVKTLPDKEKAMALGDIHNQDAIFDLQKMEEIPLLYNVEHRGKGGLAELDPAFYGSGQAGEEKQRANDPDFLKRLYLTISGTPVEKRFEGLPVSLGKVRRSEIYHMEQDPLNLIARAQAEAQGKGTDKVRTTFEKLAKQNGFKGYTDGNTIAWFEKLPVSPKSPQKLISQRIYPTELTKNQLKTVTASPKGKVFEEQNFPGTATVRVHWDNPNDSIVDEVQGLNKGHALVRAGANWPDAKLIEILKWLKK